VYFFWVGGGRSQGPFPFTPDPLMTAPCKPEFFPNPFSFSLGPQKSLSLTDPFLTIDMTSFPGSEPLVFDFHSVNLCRKRIFVLLPALFLAFDPFVMFLPISTLWKNPFLPDMSFSFL